MNDLANSARPGVVMGRTPVLLDVRSRMPLAGTLRRLLGVNLAKVDEGEKTLGNGRNEEENEDGGREHAVPEGGLAALHIVSTSHE
jgi:hypothetical protein